jgi:hypothetical protein
MAKSNKTPATNLDTTLDLSATDGNGHALTGTGNPAAGWETENNSTVQLATDVHYRQGDTVQPVAVDHHGDLIYDMPAGPQVVDTDHGVSSANANRATTNFDYSFDTGVGPGTQQTIQQFLASGGQFIYKIDLDPSQKTDFLTLHAVYDPTDNPSGSHVVWEDTHGNIVISDDAGDAYVTQNSQNYAFYNNLIDTDPHTKGVQPSSTVGPVGTFDVDAQVIDSHHNVLADIDSTLEIGGGAPDNGKDKLPDTLLNAQLDSTATDGHGHTLSGSGNPITGWEIENSGSYQLATDVHYRQGDIVQPDAVTDKGVLEYNMPAGPQVVDAAHGVTTANSGRAATSFDYSFDTGTSGGTPQTIQSFLASGGQFIFTIDTDPTHKNDPLTLHAVYDAAQNTGGSHVVWENSQNQTVIADDGGNAYVTQNSQNYAFYNSLIDTDSHTKGTQVSPTPGPAGTYDIEAQIVDAHHNVVADIHSTLLIG